jgi:hypothetical protein
MQDWINQGVDPDDDPGMEYVIGEDMLAPWQEDIVAEVLAWLNARTEVPGVVKELTTYCNGSAVVMVDAVNRYLVVRNADEQIYIDDED